MCLWVCTLKVQGFLVSLCLVDLAALWQCDIILDLYLAAIKTPLSYKIAIGDKYHIKDTFFFLAHRYRFSVISLSLCYFAAFMKI